MKLYLFPFYCLFCCVVVTVRSCLIEDHCVPTQQLRWGGSNRGKGVNDAEKQMLILPGRVDWYCGKVSALNCDS